MLRKTSVAAVVLALSTGAAGIAVAAEPDSYYPTKGDGRIDVIRYALDLKWKPGDKTLVGTATLKVEAEEAADSMTLDLHRAMKVRQVTVNGISVQPVHDGNDLLLPQLMVPQSRYDVVVKYAGKPRTVGAPTTNPDSTGLGWHTNGAGKVWTMQKPYGAFTWYPVNDHPDDKALYKVRLDVPDEWVGVSNGHLDDKFKSAGRTVTQFTSDRPLPSYLVTVAIGPYAKATQTGPAGVPITYWYPKGKDELLKPLKKTPDALAWLVKRLGPYPFRTAGVVLTPGRGSVESISMITLSQDEYRFGNHDVQEQVVHDLVHAWYGGSVAPEDWRDNWMGESMATYLQARYAVSRGWDSWGHWLREFERNDSFWREIYGPPGAYFRNEFGQRNVHYGGALILDRLRARIGDADFTEAMRGWPETHAHTSKGRGDYIDYLSSVDGSDIGPWLRDWLMNETTPSE